MTEYIVRRDVIDEDTERFVYRGELIRCHDCKYYEADDNETYCDTLGIFGTSPTSYCSFAKRREE